MIRTTLSGGRGWLDAPAAVSLARMDAAYGARLPTTSTGRLRAEQEEAYRKYLAGGSYAAKAGESPHEFGNAADFHNLAWLWLLAHGEDHGWYLTIKSEPWHRVYYQNRDNHLGGSTAGTPQKGFLMALTDKQQDELYEWTKDLHKRVRGENPDADILQIIQADAQETRIRVRGDNPKVDMLQDILGKVSK